MWHGHYCNEGIVKDGKIQLRDDIKLPEHSKVYILIPELEGKPTAHVYSPRLVHPKQVKEFKKEIFPIETDDEL